ncbi:DUF58 domain-containing protein [Zoogloea sp.]|jgi:uncharacterized protein (DUF58 family)|uniref:DUF58 domain-containing protein n=1 Tax=Zoogloea sp. TaxID=49181 RepID=UPI002C3A5A8A|nr:DUF58 domain-containing protein [Zoogloea sp.]HQA09753.1 DUF58 domain-containing protein [Zoogloea sp.]HQE39278.1 DUF58 domain-containing protein [Zoogloea sp.]
MSLAQFRARFQRWLFRVGGPEPAPIRLGQRRIFVLPSRFGLALGITLLAMLLASINYTLSLGFALTFLIGGVAWISIHHAFRNLVDLAITPGRSDAVFCGSPARFGILLHNAAHRSRLGLVLFPTQAPTLRTHPFDLSPESTATQEIAIPTATRGWLTLPRLTLETRHPLGLIRAWSLFQPDQRCLVYPAPEADAPPLPLGDDSRSGAGAQGRGRDDFAGLRHHQPADSPRHVAWKAVARGGPWRTKEFAGAGSRRAWLDWQQLPAGLGVEARLSRLARWIVDADASGIDYGLRLPGVELRPAHGAPHRHACLTALALFGAPDERSAS